ncbi:MAG: hypothetical protein QOH61_1603 [Chloroflexota bacterium]|jgi:hypothetical protein|nr:hypothetical protein [Chloroflexota bacterium]
MQVDLIVLLPDAGGRIATVGRDGDDGPGRLPTVRIGLDPDERALPPARRAIAEALGIDAPVLEVHVPAGVQGMDPVPMLIVFEAPGAGWQLPDGAAWLEADALDPDGVPDAIRARASDWLAEIAGATATPALRAAWSRAGWLGRAAPWLDGVLRDNGRTRSGPVEQMRQWGISALLRTETDRGAVWVKAAYPHFAAEPRITRVLADRFPGALPRILGWNDDEAWLALEDLGKAEVGDQRGDAIGTDAVRLLVHMQREMAADTAALMGAGAAHRPLERLADDLAAAFTEAPPPVEWRQSVQRRAELVERVRADAVELAGIGIAESLVHGDFHSGNVAVVDGRPVIFDWTDGAVSHPLVDFATWVGYVDDPTQRPALWQAWVGAWSDVVPEAELAPLYQQVLALGSAYQVVSYAAILRGLERATQAPMAHGAVDFANLLDAAVAAREGRSG